MRRVPNSSEKYFFDFNVADSRLNSTQLQGRLARLAYPFHFTLYVLSLPRASHRLVPHPTQNRPAQQNFPVGTFRLPLKLL